MMRYGKWPLLCFNHFKEINQFWFRVKGYGLAIGRRKDAGFSVGNGYKYSLQIGRWYVLVLFP